MSESTVLAWALVFGIGVGTALLPASGRIEGLWKVLVGAALFVIVPLLIAAVQGYALGQIANVLMLAAGFDADPYYLRRSVLFGYMLVIYCAALAIRRSVSKRKGLYKPGSN